MSNHVLYPVGIGDSCRFAGTFLARNGMQLTDHPSPEITHLLLDIPSFDTEGRLRDSSDLKQLLRMLPGSISVIGGNLDVEALREYRKIDLLKDQRFLARNAAITAECAFQAASPYLTTTFSETPVLILGWGRIGKCLATLLSQWGCPVTVAARKASDRAMLEGLGFRAVDFLSLESEIPDHRLLFNTAPCGIALQQQHAHCIKIDLASLPGLQGHGVIPARGLPGKYAPESSGKLIADTVYRILKEETS